MPLDAKRPGFRLDPLDAECPSHQVIDLIADKWPILVISAIAEGEHRNGELLRRVGGISQKALTRTLRDLERNGLLVRTDHHESPPRVDYRLTATGESLRPILSQMCEWATVHLEEVETARRRHRMLGSAHADTPADTNVSRTTPELREAEPTHNCQ